MKTFENLQNSLLSLLILALSSLVATPAFSEAVSCDQIFRSHSTPLSQSNDNRLSVKTKNYRKEFVESKGLRLFLKNSEYDSDLTKWYGFLTKMRLDPNKSKLGRYFHSVVNYVPKKLGERFSREEGYYFTPYQGLYNVLFRMPVEYLSSKTSNLKLEPTNLFKIPIMLTLSLAPYFAADTAYNQGLQYHINYEISQHSAQYDKLIQSDFRYSKVKLSLEKGEISQKDARREAYLVTLAYTQYFQFRNSHDEVQSLQSEKKLLDHYLFSQLRNVITYGVPKAGLQDGYFIPDSSVGPISEAKALELFNNTHQRYLKYQIISEMVAQTPLWLQIRVNPKFSEIVDSIVSDPFTTQLYQLKDGGKISSNDLQFYLQEDAYWKNSFQDWQTIGIIKLKKVEGHYVNQALTLSDIRQEILVEIIQREKISKVVD